MLDPEGIREHLNHPEAWEIHTAEEVTSTNDAVLRLPATSGTTGSVLFAESQTAGRGRRGNAWFSGPLGSNLLFSCLVHPTWPPVLWGRLTHIMALVLKQTLDDYPPAQPMVKWPNDIFLGDQKVSGILVETEIRGDTPAHAVIGVGINVNLSEDKIPEALRGQATSLRAVTRTWIDREMLAARILNGLTEALNSPPEAFVTVLEELKSSYYLMNKPIRARLGDGTVEGLVVDLGSEGELIVETSEGSREQLTSVDEVRVISRPRS